MQTRVRVFGVAVLLASTALPVFGQTKVVTFHADDGVKLTADYRPPPVTQKSDAPMVILIHGAEGDRSAWAGLVSALHENGFAVLAPDLRGHGDSATTETRQRAAERDSALYRQMQVDIRAAYDWLAKQPKVDRARFALVGAEAGSGIALCYAAKDRSVDALVCLSPKWTEYGLDAVGDARQLTGRKVMLAGAEDERDALYTLEKNIDGAYLRPPIKTDERGTALLEKERDLADAIAGYLKTAVGEASTQPVCGSVNSNVYHMPDSKWVHEIAPTNLRYYSSADEAKARGLRASKSRGPGRVTADAESEDPPKKPEGAGGSTGERGKRDADGKSGRRP